MNIFPQQSERRTIQIFSLNSGKKNKKQVFFKSYSENKRYIFQAVGKYLNVTIHSIEAIH
jgi:hypothetical protein